MTSLVPPWFGKTVIRSNHQLHYYQAQAIADGAPPPSREDVLPPRKPRASPRTSRWCPRSRQRYDAKHNAAPWNVDPYGTPFPDEVGRPRRNGGVTKGEVPMMRVVAELMIAANAAVAARVRDEFPSSALLRRHAPPGIARVELLRHSYRRAPGIRLLPVVGRDVVAIARRGVATRARSRGGGTVSRNGDARHVRGAVRQRSDGARPCS